MDPAVRMAFTPGGGVQNNCFEKTLKVPFPNYLEFNIIHEDCQYKSVQICMADNVIPRF